MKRSLKILRDAEVQRKNSVGHADSVEKVLGQLALLTPERITYQAPSLATGKMRKEIVFDAPVEQILVTPSLFRKFICTDGCTACCQKFTLDYIPREIPNVEHSEGFSERKVLVNGSKRTIWTNDQNQNPICDFLRVQRPGGGLGCANYLLAPLSCISAPQLQFIQMRPGKTYILKKPFGRAWAMTPEPECQFVEFASMEEFEAEMTSMLRILTRFAQWGDYFCLDIPWPQIFRGIKNGSHNLEGAAPVWTSA